MNNFLEEQRRSKVMAILILRQVTPKSDQHYTRMDSIMEWEITVHRDYIEIVTSGVANKEGSLEMAKAITSTMKRNRITGALIDHRNVEVILGEVIDIYERPRIFRLIGVIWGIKVAEVIKPDHQEHFKFLETVCINQGYRFSTFREKDQALKWLLA